MAVCTDCRHYVVRSTSAGDKIQRCRLDANLDDPFACPDGCVFYERRGISAAGWQVGRPPTEPDSTEPGGDVHP
jgi:hypothetical protein